MSMRNTVDKRLDHAIFKRTASQTKKINIRPVSMRGGTRL